MSYKCKAIDINTIQYHLIHVIITHDSNIHFYIEMYMIIITIIINMCIMHKNIRTCYTLPILSDISPSLSCSHLAMFLSAVS